ncbi:hypothetical protein V8E51_001153 [Hyaloscypha variabilis]
MATGLALLAMVSWMDYLGDAGKRGWDGYTRTDAGKRIGLSMRIGLAKPVLDIIVSSVFQLQLFLKRFIFERIRARRAPVTKNENIKLRHADIQTRHQGPRLLSFESLPSLIYSLESTSSTTINLNIKIQVLTSNLLKLQSTSFLYLRSQFISHINGISTDSTKPPSLRSSKPLHSQFRFNFIVTFHQSIMSTSHNPPYEAVRSTLYSASQPPTMNIPPSASQGPTSSLKDELEEPCPSSQNIRNQPHINLIVPSNNQQRYSQNPPSQDSHPPLVMAHQERIAFNPALEKQSHATKLQDRNKDQSEQITELRIKVAVLENELLHAKKDKEAVEKGLGIVIASLTRFHTLNSSAVLACDSHGNTRDVGLSKGTSTANGDKFPEGGGQRFDVRGLEKENEYLRRENRVLRKREADIGYEVAMKNLLGQEGEQHVHFQSEMSGVGSVRDKGKGKERAVNGAGLDNHFHSKGGNGAPTPEQLVGSWGNSNHSFQHDGDGNVLTSKDLIGSWGNPSFTAGDPGPSNTNNSFGSGSTTVPNTPIFDAASFDSSFVDVGMHSLEENMDMDSDGFPPSLSFPPSNANSNTAADKQAGDEEEKDIDEQLQEQQAALEKFNAIPKPSVLNVGFSLEGTKRGNDYDTNPFTNSQPYPQTHSLTYHREGSMQDYQRFSSRRPPSGPRSSFTHSPSFDLKIPGDLSGDQDLWTDNQERKDAVQVHMQAVSSRLRDAEIKYPEFFRYGIRYLPAKDDSNYFRTVMLTNLPPDTSIRDVLDRVRGGEVLSAILLDTKSITGSLSARIVFRNETAAEAYTLYCTSHLLLFPSSSDPSSDTQQATATHLQTPTFPLSSRHLSRLTTHAQTRCLALPSFPPSFSLNTLERHLSKGSGVRGDMLAETWIDEEGTLHLQFSSVFWAGAAFGILTSFAMYRGLEVLFADDPCAGPVEELSTKVRPRPSLFARNWAELQRRYASSAVSSSLDIIGGVGGEIVAEQRKRVLGMGKGGDEVVNEVQGMQRKRLAALDNQKVEIPSFSGTGIQGGSWADEVIDELEDDSAPIASLSSTSQLEGREGEGLAPPPNSPIHVFTQHTNGGFEDGVKGGETSIDARMLDTPNEKIVHAPSTWNHHPVGLSGSKYAPRSTSPTSPSLFNPSPSQPIFPISNYTSEHNLSHENGEQDPVTEAQLMQTTKQNKSPPKVPLQELLASPASSVASSPTTTTQTRCSTSNSNHLATDGAVVREPRGPRGRGNGFGGEKMKGYESEEAEAGSGMEGLGLGLRVQVDGVRNPDEILLEGEVSECEVEDGA